jgi:ribose transport system substrate-binding protein
METSTAIVREKGVRQALEGMNIVGTWFIDVERKRAYQVTLKLLENENLKGIIALNEAAALGVADAVAERGAKGRVWVVGFDNAIKELEYLEAEVIDALIVQRPYNMGYLTVKTAADYLLGKRVKPFQDTGSLLITKENMFNREYQELLFPVESIQ